MSAIDLSALSSADAPYWQWLAKGELRLPQCAGCHRWMWPAEFRCAACGAFGLDWVEVEPEGVVYSWTRTWYPFMPERAGELPYRVVLAELPEAGGARLLGVFEGKGDELRIGQRVVGSIHPASEVSRGFPTLRWSFDG